MRALFIAAVVGIFASLAPGQVVYSSFGPGESHEDWVWEVGLHDGTSNTLAMPFTVSQSGALGDIRLPIHYFNSGPNQLSISVYSDDGGQPDAPLETLTTPGVAGATTILTVTSVLRPELAEGTDYWMVLSSEGRFGWALSWLDQTGFMRSTDGGATWEEQSGTSATIAAFSVAIPEPAAGLLAMALLPVLSLRRRAVRR